MIHGHTPAQQMRHAKVTDKDIQTEPAPDNSPRYKQLQGPGCVASEAETWSLGRKGPTSAKPAGMYDLLLSFIPRSSSVLRFHATTILRLSERRVLWDESASVRWTRMCCVSVGDK
jgi:hypothetical protein